MRRDGRPRAERGTSVTAVAIAFALVAGLFVVEAAVAAHRSRDVRAATAQIVDNALTSVQLVARIGRDVDRMRLLVDEHLLETGPGVMARVEDAVAETRADYAEAARAYSALATLPSEGETWSGLQREIAAVQKCLDDALALSRANRDDEARAVLASHLPQFVRIEDRLAELIRLNQVAASSATARVVSLEESSLRLVVATTCAGLALSVALGARAARLVRRREAEMARTAWWLEARNRELDAFAGRVAHDLRGPLTTIRLGLAGVHEPAGALAIVWRGVGRMESLIDDLLALSRVDEQALRGTSDPSNVAAQVAEEMASRLEEAHAALRLAVKHDEVRCAEGLLREAMWNLVENALKYRRPDAEPAIDVCGERRGEAYELRIADNGKGMSPDDARQAFEPFFRAHATRNVPGTGLGLSIVKRIVDAVGGTVTVQSQLGRGTTFVLRLPLTNGAAR